MSDQLDRSARTRSTASWMARWVALSSATKESKHVAQIVLVGHICCQGGQVRLTFVHGSCHGFDNAGATRRDSGRGRGIDVRLMAVAQPCRSLARPTAGVWRVSGEQSGLRGRCVPVDGLDSGQLA